MVAVMFASAANPVATSKFVPTNTAAMTANSATATIPGTNVFGSLSRGRVVTP